MDAVDYILDGLAAELALERELGVRAVEFDRALLSPPPGRVAVPGRVALVATDTPASGKVAVPGDRQPATGRVAVPSDRQPATGVDFVFLHDKPFSPGAADIIAKITTALGKTAETAPAVFAPPEPDAKAYVILGFAALRKWAPGAKAEPGQWVALPGSRRPALVTYSPEWFLRFGTTMPNLKAKKKEMWDALKALQRRIMQ